MPLTKAGMRRILRRKDEDKAIMKGWTSELMNYIGTGNRSDPAPQNETLQKLYEEKDKLDEAIAKEQEALNKACERFNEISKEIAHKAIQVKLNPLKPYRKLEALDD